MDVHLVGELAADRARRIGVVVQLLLVLGVVLVAGGEVPRGFGLVAPGLPHPAPTGALDAPAPVPDGGCG